MEWALVCEAGVRAFSRLFTWVWNAGKGRGGGRKKEEGEVARREGEEVEGGEDRK